MKAEIKNGELILTLPINTTPQLSKSGKTLVVATSNGCKPTAAVINGRPVIAVVTAYIQR